MSEETTQSQVDKILEYMGTKVIRPLDVEKPKEKTDHDKLIDAIMQNI
jgi:glycine betaine/choline ABC-type transport system substrate-binding protein